MRNLLTVLFIFFSAIASATNYYVSSAGNDSNNGTSTSTPWATIAKINERTFSPGDQILFNRENTWSVTVLTIPSSGTAGNPIIFGNYGSGNLPIFSKTGVVEINIIGKQYVTVDGINITDPTISATDHSIMSNISYGVNLNNSSNIIIKNCDISLVGCGVQIYNGSINNTVTNNHIHNLRMVVNTSGGSDDWGANGVIIGNSSNTITHNTFDECWATSLDFGYDGGTVEFYSNGGASISNNIIEYNAVINCNGFLEIGGGSGGTCANNIVAYNKIINCGIIGSYHANDAYSMTITNLQYYNNIVIQTVQQYTKPGVLFYAGSSPTSGMVVLKNNIFWLADGATDVTWTSNSFNSGQMTHTNNYYRISTGSVVNLTLGAGETSSSSATMFVSAAGDVSTWDLHPINSSPTIKTGTNVGLTSDFEGNAINNPPSIGTYESGSTSLAVPVYVSSAVAIENPSLLEMTYNLALANVIPATSAFSVLVNSAARTVSTVAISGTKVQLTLASPIVNGDVVMVAYTKPSANPLQTASAGQAESLSSQTVANGVTGIIPAYVSSVVENATSSLLVLTYSLSLSTAKGPPASSYSVIVNGVARTVNTVSISTNKVQLNLASAIKYGDVITTTYTKPATNPLQTPNGGIAASFSAMATTNNLAAVIKDAAPVTMSMTISPNHIYKTIYVLIAYSSTLTTAQITTFTPQILRIADLSGKLYVEQILVTGSTSLRLPVNLRSGIYNVLILANGAQMAMKRIKVY